MLAVISDGKKQTALWLEPWGEQMLPVGYPARRTNEVRIEATPPRRRLDTASREYQRAFKSGRQVAGLATLKGEAHLTCGGLCFTS
jgi:hypothetical protein